MKILALEFSSRQRSAAIVEGTNSRVLGFASGCSRENAALDLVEQVLRESNSEREEVEIIAVGIGPGSYTGIRGAIALAQGWQLASEGKIKLLGLSSSECLARAAQHKNHFGKITVVIDAQRNEIYTATYEISAQDIREIKSLHLASIEEAQAAVRNGEIILGPEVKRWVASGIELFPEASALGEMASNRNGFLAGEDLQPIYLRETAFVKAPPPRIVL